MTIDILREEKKVCLQLQGSLVGVTAAALQQTVQELLEEYPHICLDMQRVESLSDAGVQTLAQIQQGAVGVGGCVQLLVRIPVMQKTTLAHHLTNLTIV